MSPRTFIALLACAFLGACSAEAFHGNQSGLGGQGGASGASGGAGGDSSAAGTGGTTSPSGVGGDSSVAGATGAAGDAGPAGAGAAGAGVAGAGAAGAGAAGTGAAGMGAAGAGAAGKSGAAGATGTAGAGAAGAGTAGAGAAGAGAAGAGAAGAGAAGAGAAGAGAAGAGAAGAGAAGAGAAGAGAAGAPPLPILAINAGSTVAVGSFVADEDFTNGTLVDHSDTIDTSAVTNPAPMAVYQSGRTGTFSYTIPGYAASSSHKIRLHFCETYFPPTAGGDGTGARVCTVGINGAQLLQNFDIYVAAGGKDKAIVKEFTEPASATGQYVITFTPSTNQCVVAGIEVQ